MLKKIILITLYIFLATSSVVFGVYIASIVTEPINPTFTEDGSQIVVDKPQSGRVNVLFAGLDVGGYRSDTIMVASIDLLTKKISVLSIPRDTRIKLNGSYAKINAAIGTPGRVQTLINAIKEITDLPINYYVTVENDGFRNIIDKLGGVYIDVPQDMRYRDPVQKLNINLKKGYQLLDGDKAEQFVRFRSYPNADYERIKAQQMFMRELIKQKLTLQNIANAKEIFNEAKKYVSTNIGVSDILKYVDLLKSVDSSSVQFFTLPSYAEYINKISYVLYSKEEVTAFIKENFSVTTEAELSEPSNDIQSTGS